MSAATTKFHKIEAAIARFDKVISDTGKLLDQIRDMRFRNIQETQKRYAELQAQTQALVSQNPMKPMPSPPPVKIT